MNDHSPRGGHHQLPQALQQELDQLQQHCELWQASPSKDLPSHVLAAGHEIIDADVEAALWGWQRKRKNRSTPPVQ